jgi:hypothetical protein
MWLANKSNMKLGPVDGRLKLSRGNTTSSLVISPRLLPTAGWRNANPEWWYLERLTRNDRQLLGDWASIDFQKSEPSMCRHWVRRKIKRLREFEGGPLELNVKTVPSSR